MWALPKGWSPSGVECPSVGPSRKPAPEDSSFLQSSKGCRVDIYSTMVLHALQGENMLHKSLLPSTCSTSLLSSLWPWYLQSCFSLLSLTPFPKHTQRCHQCEWLTQLGLGSVSPGATWNGLCPTRSSSQSLLPEAIPASPCSKTLPQTQRKHALRVSEHTLTWTLVQLLPWITTLLYQVSVSLCLAFLLFSCFLID